MVICSPLYILSRWIFRCFAVIWQHLNIRIATFIVLIENMEADGHESSPDLPQRITRMLVEFSRMPSNHLSLVIRKNLALLKPTNTEKYTDLSCEYKRLVVSSRDVSFARKSQGKHADAVKTSDQITRILQDTLLMAENEAMKSNAILESFNDSTDVARKARGVNEQINVKLGAGQEILKALSDADGKERRRIYVGAVFLICTIIYILGKRSGVSRLFMALLGRIYQSLCASLRKNEL